jgi:hypothetical protein
MVTGMDDSVTTGVVAAVTKAGDCEIGEIIVGELRRSPRGLTSMWLHCPLTATKRICASGSFAGGDGGGPKKIIVEWCEARIPPLPTHRLQCFQCLEPGHVRKDCKSSTDRSDRCYCCGEPGHQTRECSSQVPRSSEDTPKEREAGSACGKNEKETKVGQADPEKSGQEKPLIPSEKTLEKRTSHSN